MKFNEYYYLLNEALSNELMYLKRYLTMDDESKSSNRGLEYPYLIKDFLKQEDIENEEFEDMEDYEIAEWLYENDPETLMKYGEYVYGEREYYNSSEPQLYDVVDFRNLERQQWLIHFSDNALDIVNDQNFTIGMPYEDYQRLALTTHFKNISKTGGFNFAYDVDDVEKYYRGTHGSKYGKDAVLFKGDGIKVWHSGDEEPQVIFDGKATKKPLIYIQSDYDNWFIESSKTGERIVQKEKISDIADWVDQNYNQYRKHLEP